MGNLGSIGKQSRVLSSLLGASTDEFVRVGGTDGQQLVDLILWQRRVGLAGECGGHGL